MKLRYVLYSEEAGIYLGSCMGLGFWSKMDPAGQDRACTFAGKDDVEAWKKSLDHPENLPDFHLVEVWPDLPDYYASIDACANAQLPRWNPDNK